jgi:hypothetical protein
MMARIEIAEPRAHSRRQPMDFNPEPSGLNMLCSDMNE